MENVVQINRDPFARHDIVRRVVQTHSSCTWCGSKQSGGGLFEYGTQPDDNGRVNWHKGLFCSKSCHDSYHGGQGF